MKSFDTLWEEIHATEEWGKYPSESVIRYIARNYYEKNRKSTRILDFCCGAGSNTWYLAKEGFDTYAFDGSQSAIDKVKRRFAQEGLQADLRVYDALETEYDNDFFDCVIDNMSICSNKFENIKCIYEKIYSILKIGGGLFTATVSKNTTGYGTGDEVEKGTFMNIPYGNLAGRGIIHFFEDEEIISLLHEIGFHEIQTDLVHYTDRGSVVEKIIVQAKK